jgi:signal transduction histidine kinase
VTDQAPPPFDEQQIAFLRKFAHELRTPLNSVITTSEMMVRGIYGELTPKQQSGNERVLRNGDRLLRLVDDAMIYLRAHANAYPVEPGVIDLAPWATTLVTPFRDRATQKGLTLTLVVDADAPAQVNADEDILRITVGCLLDNAVQYTATGDIHVVVSGANQAGAARWRIAVQDTGIGIDAAEVRSVGLPFWRALPAKKLNPSGNGMALCAAGEVVRLHGGTLTLRSQPMLGTTVSLTLEAGRAGA